MYVISRVLTFKKGYRDDIETMFNQEPLMKKHQGFIRRDVLLNDRDPEVDVIRVLIYWENKEAYYRFEGSPEHIAMHQQKDHPHHQKPEGLIDSKRESFILIHSDQHE